MNLKKIISFGNYFKAIIFNEKAIELISKKASLKLVIIAFLLSTALQAMPINLNELNYFPTMWLIISSNYLMLFAGMFLVLKLFKSKTNATEFFSVIGVIYFFTMVLTTVVAFLSIILFEFLLNNDIISGLVQSILPYYLFVLFGWSNEIVSRLKGIKAIAIAIIAITLIFAFHVASQNLIIMILT